jgi:hypothetical protein
MVIVDDHDLVRTTLVKFLSQPGAGVKNVRKCGYPPWPTLAWCCGNCGSCWWQQRTWLIDLVVHWSGQEIAPSASHAYV